ncbi:MAG: DUF2752 domain-containing protein [Atopobiaceae bacterium]|nr:DUF2752 domain-containing protein [Atopobiaceae bacterium]
MKLTNFKKHITCCTSTSVARSILAVLAAVFVIAHTGCPIKFWTGISCPGCGMTRAWISALTLRFDLALAYHPLFWMVPPLFVVVARRDHIPHRVYLSIILVSLATFVVIWGIRFAIPREAHVLFSELLEEKVVTVDTPEWVTWLRAVVDYVTQRMGGS